MRRKVLLAVAVVQAVLILLGAPLSARPSTVDPETESDLAERIQILGINETEGDADSGERSIVTLEVAVPPAIGRLEPTPDDFAVADGGQLVDITIEPISTASDTVVVLDTSGSMRGPALVAAKAAASSFVEALPSDTRVALVSFGETVETHQSPTLDRAGILAELDALEAGGAETVLWDALVDAAEIVGGPGAVRSSVVVLSDGDDTNSTATQADVVRQLEPGSTVLYAVAIESPDTNLVALEGTVDQVSGQFLATTDIDELDVLYADIAGRLASRYELRFTAAGTGERTVVVSVATDNGIATARTTIGHSAGVAADHGTAQTANVPFGKPPPVLNVDDQPILSTVGVPTPTRLADPMMLWIGLGAVFFAIALVGLNLAQPRKTTAFTTAAGADRVSGMNARLGQSLERMLSNHDRGRKLDARLEAADLNLRPGEFVLAWLFSTAAVWLLATTFVGVAFGVFALVLTASGALLLLGFRANRRRSRFADQLTDTLGIMASSLRSGQSLPKSVELVASEAPSPTAEEFHRISFEIRVGRDLTESIRDASLRVDSPDLEWLAQAVDINRELGGDLTEILDNVAATIRERRTVARQIDALSAEGRASGWVMLAMPIVLFLFSWWRTPDSINAMTSEPVGRILLIVAATGLVVGHLWIRRMVRLKF